GVNAEGRLQIVVETEIGRRKADRPPAPVAGGDAAVDLPKPAEEYRSLARLSGLQQLTDMGRGIDRRVPAADRIEHRDAEAVLCTSRAQHIGGPAAAIAEGTVPADDDMARADRPDDDLGDEVLRTLGGKAEIEMLDEQQIDAESRQFALLDAERRQPERLARGKEHAARMRLEGQHRDRPALSSRQVADLADHHRMPAMQAVEIAHREDRTTRVVRSGAGMSDDADHGSGARFALQVTNRFRPSPAAAPTGTARGAPGSAMRSSAVSRSAATCRSASTSSIPSWSRR